MEILDHLLRSPIAAERIDSLSTWWPRFRALEARWTSPIERAIAAGFEADRLGWAFAGAYRSALRVLAPSIPDDAMAALCITEGGGNTPRAIQTRLRRDGGDGMRLDGDKQWTTLGPASSTLLVAARIDEADASRPELRVVRVASDAPGVSIHAMVGAPFVPEIPHASVSLRGVRVRPGDVLEGDGYDRYVRPFRTIEDIHVNGAVLGYVVRELRARGAVEDRGAIEDALAQLAALRTLADADASAPGTHLALAGVIAGARRVLAELDQRLAPADDEVAERWRRDRVLTSVASSARARRTERAWSRVD